jgi:hypothetical protein
MREANTDMGDYDEALSQALKQELSFACDERARVRSSILDLEEARETLSDASNEVLTSSFFFSFPRPLADSLHFRLSRRAPSRLKRFPHNLSVIRRESCPGNGAKSRFELWQGCCAAFQ